VRIVFLGTPEIAVPHLRAVHAAGHHIPLVITGADKRRGRGGRTSPSPVKQAALELGLPVSHSVDDAVDVDADLGVVVAFGRIIRPHVLDRLPMINVHFSLLPRWRGAAPVERAILAGDETTGVDLMRVEEGLDTGAVYARAELPIGPDDTADDVRAALVERGIRLLVDRLDTPAPEWLDHGSPQTGETTYAEKLSPADLELDWSRPDAENHRIVRVGGAWTTFRGRRLKVHAAVLRDGRLVPTVVQPEGKPRMDFDAWRNGARPGPDELFGDLT
jgi:methionyl-tRNA formyltransferase